MWHCYRISFQAVESVASVTMHYCVCCFTWLCAMPLDSKDLIANPKWRYCPPSDATRSCLTLVLAGNHSGCSSRIKRQLAIVERRLSAHDSMGMATALSRSMPLRLFGFTQMTTFANSFRSPDHVKISRQSTGCVGSSTSFTYNITNELKSHGENTVGVRGCV